MTPARTRLGSSAHVFGRESVYEFADGVEVEATENYEVIRRRVLFEDILLVTYHREIGALFVILNALVGSFFLFIGFVIVSVKRTGNVWPFLIPWLVMAFPFLLAAALRSIFGVDVISVFGRRSKAQVRFTFRKARARETYGRILARVRQAQRAMETEVAETAAAEETVPMPPTESLLP